MDLWLAHYKDAKAGLATHKGLKHLDSFDVFEFVERQVKQIPDLGKRGRGEDDFLVRLNEALILYEHKICTMLETALDNYPIGCEKLRALPPLPSRDDRERERAEEEEVVLK
tara:strand:- start:421 stop:756 length:336 start_codon:yes stop_codon:yes gene_type:complete